MKTIAAIYHESGQPLLVDEIECPSPGPGEVLVKQFATGICHSQLHQLHDLALAQPPSILGHESSGVVAAVGPGVEHVREGDRVLVSWLPRSPGYSWSAPAKPTYRWRNLAVGPGTVIGTWAEHVVLNEQYVTLLPDDLPTDATAIIGCAVMTGAGAVLNAADVRPGQSVAVFGVGGVGLASISAAAAVGANPIIAIDLDDRKLELAIRFGATQGLNARHADPVEAIVQWTGGGVDAALDATGVPDTIENALHSVRAGTGGHIEGGVAVLIGIPMGETTLDLRPLLYRRYRGAWGGLSVPDRDFPTYFDWYRQGKLPLADLITDRFQLAEINQALHALESGRIVGRALVEF